MVVWIGRNDLCAATKKKDDRIQLFHLWTIIASWFKSFFHLRTSNQSELELGNQLIDRIWRRSRTGDLFITRYKSLTVEIKTKDESSDQQVQ